MGGGLLRAKEKVISCSDHSKGKRREQGKWTDQGNQGRKQEGMLSGFHTATAITLTTIVSRVCCLSSSRERLQVVVGSDRDAVDDVLVRGLSFPVEERR